MKKVINGKVYNTETAELLHEWENEYYTNDFKYCEENLYRTQKGAYFLSGSGGAMSKYSRSCGNNSWGGGHGMEVLTKEEAINWLEEHDGSDVLMERFTDDIEEA